MSLFDKKANDYDDWCSTQVGLFVDLIEKELMMEAAKPIQGETALDLGCGTGNYAYWLLDQGLTVTGVDLSIEMLKAAKEKNNAEKIKFIHGNIHALPFQNESFDLIVSNIVLEFTENPSKIVREALRVLKRGGRFVCGLIGKDSVWGKMYQEKGKRDLTSVFSKARFLSLDEIKQLDRCPPDEIRYGLFIGIKYLLMIIRPDY